MARRLAERGDGRGGVLVGFRRAAGGAASRLRLAAGRAFGRSQASERGTILLMVIGVLAMMSIITVVYVTIGQGDRRNAAMLEREVRLDDQATAIADYLAGVVGADLFTVIEEQSVVTGSTDVRLLRETTDYPWMPEGDYLVSIPNTGATNEVPFDPAGTGEGVVGLTPPSGGQPLKMGQGGDPWLSATEPARLDTVGNRTFGSLPEALQIVDWPQISNFSPNGLFVNLYALRPNASGFYASPGTEGTVTDPQMSRLLTLYRDSSGLVQPATGNQVRPDGSVADPNIPSHWTRNQVWLHRPAIEIQTGPGAPGPGTAEYAPYQYADADGDGMFDSRWFELVRWDELGQQFHPVVRSESQARLFVAARCIDLSGLVNVQVAADFERGPNQGQPAGFTPADIDLRRLLRLKDAYDQFTEVYEQYQQPPQPPPPGISAANYAGPGANNAYNADQADEVGIGAYGALRLALRDGVVPPLFAGALQGYSPGGQAEPFVLDRAGRAAQYAELASAAEAARFVDVTDGYTFARPFGLADELELRTYHGANDSSQTSRFEATVAGRDPDLTSALFGDSSNHDPLRSNRPLAVERGGRGDRTTGVPFPVNDGRPDRDALLQAATDIRRLLTFFSGARPLRSVVVGLPTEPILGDRNGFNDQIDLPSPPYVPGTFIDGVNHGTTPPTYSEVPAPRREVRLDMAAALEAASADTGIPGNATRDEAIRTIFAAYAKALMPYLGEEDQATTAAMWEDPINNAQARQYRTLFYGHRGPELAMRIAAHLTVNAIDMYDGTSTAGAVADDPTAVRVYFTDPTAGGGTPVLVTDHTDINLNTTLRQDVLRPASITPPPGSVQQELRVYGIEAQPFLTEVAVFHMFTDSPGEDNDAGWNDLDGDGMYTEGVDELWKVTINGDIDVDNSDFLFQCIAFQVYNPFNVPVDMSHFYFEFGRTLFVPVAATTLLQPGEERVFFVTNPIHGAVNSRLTAAGAPTGTTINSWLQAQFGIDPTQINYHLLRRLDLAGNNIPLTDVVDLFAQTDIAGTPSPDDRVALMWRKYKAGTTGASGYNQAARENDILADRLRDPTPLADRSTWDRRFDLPDIGGQNDIVEGTGAGPNPGDGDDTGYAITLYGTVVRPREVTATTTMPPGISLPEPPLGAIPSFCIERKSGWDPTGPTTISLNTPEDDGVNNTSALSKGDFDPGVASADVNLTDLLAEQGAETGELPGLGLNETPVDKATGVDPNGHTHLIGGSTPLPAGSFFFRYPEIHLNNNEFGVPASGGNPAGPRGELLRPGDMLLPLGIGPSRAVNIGGLQTGEHALEREWMTLAEALCLATGTDHDQGTVGPTPDSTAHPANLFHRFYEDVLDRGNLRLDWFVAFKDENPTGAADFSALPIFMPDEDYAPYPAVPFAARVLDAFRANPFGGERRAVPGVININTAPLSVLRLLPMFTPPFEGSWMSSPNTAQNVAGDLAQTQSHIFPATAHAHPVGEYYDVAVTAKAYRDKVAVETRLHPDNPTPGRLVDFTDDPTVDTDGRSKAQIDGLRSEPGFSVPGEILALQIRARTDTAANGGRPTFADSLRDGSFANTDIDLDGSINRFGFSRSDPNYSAGDVAGWVATERTFRTPGIDSSTYEDPLGNPVSDGIVNEYDEQLAIANAVLGSITTRSDLFCVWFVVHGYLPSDCEALGANDPLLPSIARRYVMVVDRSNVQRPSDKPRILLFQEVPM